MDPLWPDPSERRGRSPYLVAFTESRAFVAATTPADVQTLAGLLPSIEQIPAEMKFASASIACAAWLVGSASASFLVVTAANTGWWLVTLLVLAVGFYIFVSVKGQMPEWQWRVAALVAVPTHSPVGAP